MRLWSLHPKYLDFRGLAACWREGLLARKVLEGATKGYRNHPQLLRFRSLPDPVAAMDAYLNAVYEEALQRGYQFDKNKIKVVENTLVIPVTFGQLRYEREHLLQKLALRDSVRRQALESETTVEAHPLFRITEGEIEIWEKI